MERGGRLQWRDGRSTSSLSPSTAPTTSPPHPPPSVSTTTTLPPAPGPAPLQDHHSIGDSHHDPRRQPSGPRTLVAWRRAWPCSLVVHRWWHGCAQAWRTGPRSGVPTDGSGGGNRRANVLLLPLLCSTVGAGSVTPGRATGQGGPDRCGLCTPALQHVGAGSDPGTRGRLGPNQIHWPFAQIYVGCLALPSLTPLPIAPQIGERWCRPVVLAPNPACHGRISVEEGKRILILAKVIDL